MRSIRRWLARFIMTAGISIALVSTTTVVAQTGGAGGGGAPGGGLGGAGGGLGGAGGGLGGAGGGLGGAGGGLGGAGGGLGGAGGGMAGGAGGGGGASPIDKTNFLAPTFSNPAYMGRPNQTSSNSTASATTSSTGTTNVLQGLGGFGTPSFGVTGTATASTSRTGGMSSGSSSSFTGSSPYSTRLSYAATLKFAPKPVVSSELQARLSDIISRSTRLKYPAAIRVVIEDQTVVLRGKAADDDERRLAEGMIRLTPGVRTVRNELEVP